MKDLAKLAEWKAVLEEASSQDTVIAEKAPYSSEFIVDYCRTHWSTWVNKVHETMVRTQEEVELLSMPTRRLSTIMTGLEQMLPPMLMVRQLPTHSAMYCFRLRRDFKEGR